MLKIERKVVQVRANFSRAMVKKKGYLSSYEEIDALFDFKQNAQNRINAEVKSKIKEIQDRNVSS